MKRKVTIKADSSFNRIENRHLGKLDYACQSAGYRLDSALWIDNRLKLDIIPIGDYATIITVDRDDPSIVKAQTVAYGKLSPDEYREFADQAAKTAHLLRVLEEFDFNELPHMEDK